MLLVFCGLCLLEVSIGCSVARARFGDEIQWGVVNIFSVPSQDSLKAGELGDGTFISLGSGWSTTRSFILEGGLQSARQLCAAIEKAGGVVGEKEVPLNELELLSPLTADGQRMMLGLNYRQHAREAGVSEEEAQDFIMMFPKMALPTAHKADVLRPPHVEFLDYELELGVVLAQDATNAIVTDDNVHEYVAGVVLVHDFSARAEQLYQQQWVKGKAFRTFGPVGPLLYLLPERGAAEILKSIRLQLWVNGELRQDASTADLIHHIPKVITEMSHTFDYRAGDAIWTGTPSGVIVGRNSAGAPVSVSPVFRALGQMIFRDSLFKFMFHSGGMMYNKKWLQDGDVVTATATGANLYLGTTKNVIKRDKSWLYSEPKFSDAPLPWHIPLFFLGILLASMMFGFFLGCCCRRTRRVDSLEHVAHRSDTKWKVS